MPTTGIPLPAYRPSERPAVDASLALADTALQSDQAGVFGAIVLGTDTATEARTQIDVYSTTDVDALIAAIELIPGPAGDDGADGASAYEIAVADGFVGTETEWIASLKGDPGSDGTDGAKGDDGDPGPNEVTTATATDLTGVLTGNGTVVSASASLPIALGGTGGNSQATAQAALGVDSSATVTTKANTAASTTYHDTRYYTQPQLASSKLTLANKNLPNSLIPVDLSVNQSCYDKNQICNAHLLPGGSITCSIDGVPYTLAAADKKALLGGGNDYSNITLTEEPTTVEFVIDTGAAILAYGTASWEPGISTRFPFSSNTFTQPRGIRVQVSANGTDWAEPTGNAWITTNTSTSTGTVDNYWRGVAGLPYFEGNLVSAPRYVKFILTDWIYDEGYVSRNNIWLTQLTLRHASHEFLPQYLKKGGDEVLGSIRFRGQVQDINGSPGTTGYVLRSAGNYVEWATPTSTFNSSLVLSALTSTVVSTVFTTEHSWINSTFATRRGQVEEKVHDFTGPRTITRAFANGTNGYKAHKVVATAPPDADMQNGEVIFHVDGSGNLAIKLKDSGGTVRTGTVTLA